MQEVLQRYKDLQDIIAILGMDELSDSDKLDRIQSKKDTEIPFAAVQRCMRSSQACEGKYLPLKETVRGFKEILEGKHDHIPEQMFLIAGGIDEVVETLRRKQ